MLTVNKTLTDFNLSSCGLGGKAKKDLSVENLPFFFFVYYLMLVLLGTKVFSLVHVVLSSFFKKKKHLNLYCVQYRAGTWHSKI